MKAKHPSNKKTRWSAWGLLAAILLVVPMPGNSQAQDTGTPSLDPLRRITSGSHETLVEPRLLTQLDADGTSGYMIYFHERPDLSAAEQMDWQERGWYTVKTLQESAARTQARVRSYLDAQGARYQAFWIENVIVVESGTRATFDGLLNMPEIASLRAKRVTQAVEPVEKNLADSVTRQSIETNLSHVKADQVWALGYRGEGLVVANIDTGVRYTHEALAPHYRGNLGNGSYEHAYNWLGVASGSATPVDDQGHGTHTMGIMVGDDNGSNQVGMAGGARWIACDACELGICPGDALLTCAQWIVAPYPAGDPGAADPDMRPHVVSNSWTICSRTYDDWFQGAVDSWHAAGIYPIFANGNASNCGYSYPPGCNTAGIPARYGNVTAVGSTGQSDGEYASHSNWGPTDNLDPVNPRGYASIKPQVVAPGVGIRSSYGGDDTQYVSMSGTSMAAPHVAGLVALMWQAGPCIAGDYATTETILETTAHPIPYATGCGGEGPGDMPNNATGWGEIDALAAVQQAQSMCLPDFTLGVTPDVQDVCAPNQATYNVALGQINSFHEPVALSASGQPGGTTVSFNPNPLTPPGTSLLTISGTGSAAAGTYTIDVTGTSNSSVQHDRLTLRLFSGAPATAALLAPADGSTGQPVTPTFRWTAAAAAGSYQVEIATDPVFAHIIDSTAGLTDTRYTLPSTLNADTVYYWRVRAINACGSANSAPGAFRTDAVPSCNDLILNGDFESGTAGWIENNDIVGQWSTPYGGTWYAELGGEKRAADEIHQPVTIPAGATGSLTYWYSISSDKSDCTQDKAGLTIGGTAIDNYDLCTANNTDGEPPYHQASAVDMADYAGTSAEIRFWATTDNHADLSTFRIDDVSMTLCTSEPAVVADYSDLAGSYGIAWHSSPGSLKLGTNWHADTTFGGGDDNGDDDGVVFDVTGNWEPGGSGTVYVNVTGGTALRYLAGWFDWNDDGDFDDASEQPVAKNVADGLNTVSFPIPNDAGYRANRTVACRFRLYESEPANIRGAETPWGGAIGGEVEDYRFTPTAPTAVILARFEATTDGMAIGLTWETASELNSMGFNLFRSEAANGNYVQLNSALIACQAPGSPLGTIYSWRDDAVAPGVRYYYRLQVLDVGDGATFYGPVSAETAHPSRYFIFLPVTRQSDTGD
jgi:subtilisin family serine protease